MRRTLLIAPAALPGPTSPPPRIEDDPAPGCAGKAAGQEPERVEDTRVFHYLTGTPGQLSMVHGTVGEPDNPVGPSTTQLGALREIGGAGVRVLPDARRRRRRGDRARHPLGGPVGSKRRDRARRRPRLGDPRRPDTGVRDVHRGSAT